MTTGEPFDVAVVGAGVVGCSVAAAVAQRGARVVVLDRGEPGGQASGAAAGMLAPWSEAHQPGPFLAAGLESLSLWPGFAATLREHSGVDCELVLDGLLRVADDDDDAAGLRARQVWQAALGGESRWLPGDEVAALEPACGGGAAGAVLHPGEGHVHSPRTVGALVATIRALGGAVRGGAEVVGIDGHGLLRLGDGAAVSAGAVVVAAGSWSAAAAAALGGPALPVRPVRGQLLAMRGLPRLPRLVLYGGGLGYAVAKRDGLLLVGATEEEAGHDSRVTAAATERLLATARQLVTGASDATLVGAWAGLRPATPDGLPLLGELDSPPRRPRLFVATGHFRNGVLLAPWTAVGMASLVLDGTAPRGWEAFDPRRFG